MLLVSNYNLITMRLYYLSRDLIKEKRISSSIASFAMLSLQSVNLLSLNWVSVSLKIPSLTFRLTKSSINKPEIYIEKHGNCTSKRKSWWSTWGLACSRVPSLISASPSQSSMRNKKVTLQPKTSSATLTAIPTSSITWYSNASTTEARLIG